MSIPPDVSIARKRHRDDEGEVVSEQKQIDRRPFIIRCSSRPLAPPRTFRPVCLFLRAHLPLAYLDTTPHGSRRFSAHITTLEEQHDCGKHSSILIAAEEAEGRLYAIERVQRRCYALCRLRREVSEALLAKHSGDGGHVSSEGMRKRRRLECADGTSLQTWWKDAAIDSPTLTSRPSDSPVLGPSLDMRVDGLTSETLPSSPDRLKVDRISTPGLHEAAVPDSLAPMEQHPTFQNVCEELSTQYLDALYISRTSLAYFTKGPLSRARAAVSSFTPGLHVLDLAAFLRGSILTSHVMDKKFREHVPKLIADLPNGLHIAPEKALERPKKKRRKFKPKRTKTGFFSNEQDFTERWWQKQDDVGVVSALAHRDGAELRQQCAKLRNRETFLQIILVLEVLALEAAAQSSQSLAKELQTASDSLDTTQAHPPEEPKTKPEKSQHLPTQLEAMLDKLCIWYSLESNSPAKKRDSGRQIDHTESNDELRDFCVEVVVPFFGARIPEYASMVNKKFDGPTGPSSAKRTSHAARKPGEIATRTLPRKGGKGASGKTSSVSATAERPSPSLQRTSSNSNGVPFIKREISEISLESIPALRNTAVRGRNASITPQLQQFSKREVDLTAVSASNEARIRRKKDVEAKLKEAVELLKKPNRALAAKDDAKRVDERFVKATAGKSKPKTNPAHPVRRNGEARDELHVDSTPSHSRIIKATPYRSSHATSQHLTSSNESKTAHIPSSSDQWKAALKHPGVLNTPSVPRTVQRVLPEPHVRETPSRGFAKFMPAGLAHTPGALESPVAARRTALVEQTPCKPVMRPLVEASPNAWTSKAAPDTDGRSGVDVSIYNALGWDDDTYEQLE